MSNFAKTLQGILAGGMFGHILAVHSFTLLQAVGMSIPAIFIWVILSYMRDDDA